MCAPVHGMAAIATRVTLLRVSRRLVMLRRAIGLGGAEPEFVGLDHEGGVSRRAQPGLDSI